MGDSHEDYDTSSPGAVLPMEVRIRLTVSVITHSQSYDMVLAQIFSHLDLPTKRSSRLVSPVWTWILNDFFTSFSARLDRNTWHTFLTSTLSYECVTVSNLSSTSPLSEDSELKEFHPEWRFSAKKLILAPFEVSLSPTQWAPLRCGKWLPSVSSDQISFLLTRCPDLEKLVFMRSSLVLSDPLSLNQLSLNNLTHLELEFSYDPSLVENERFKEIAEITTPSLSHLSLHMRISLCSHEEALEFYYSLFSVIVSKKSALKSLDFSFDVVIFPFDHALRDDVASEGVHRHLEEKIWDIQLEELKFSFCLHESVAPFNLGSKLLSNQRNLKLIQASLLNGCTHLYPLIKESIEKNAQTLTTLSVQNGSYPGKNLKAEILAAVSRCPNLESLQFSGFKINSLYEGFRCNSNTLKRLELAGTLNPSLLREIKVLSNLEFLKFWYNMSVDVSHYYELEVNLKGILTMPRLAEIKLLVGGLELDFLLDEPGIDVRGNRSGLNECTIVVLKHGFNNKLK